MSRNSFAPGKIILSGEYAVLFGFPGIAVPTSFGIKAAFEEDHAHGGVEITWKELPNGPVRAYAEKIVASCRNYRQDLRGRLTIHCDLPFGKGMGSSTALVVAITRVLVGKDARETVLAIEDALNPGHSGLDFNVIWENAPILFRKGATPKHIDLPSVQLQNFTLIDTGLPNETTAELVAWVRSRRAEIEEHLKAIGACTERILNGEPLPQAMRDHHKAQVALGVVPPKAQELIAEIESAGGVAKVIGAGGRTGGAGMVLALGNTEKIHEIAQKRGMPTMRP